MRAWWVAVIAVAFSGCDFGVKHCALDTDCDNGGVCSSGGYCLTLADAGTGGSMGGGGGGVTGGGGAPGGGGGSPGGGLGGGTANPCEGVTCLEGYQCEPSTGSCTLRVTGLVIDEPMGTLTNDAGVLVTARLTTTATVQLPRSIALVVDTGLPQDVSLGSSAYSTVIQLSEGTHTLHLSATLADAGFTASKSITVDTVGPTMIAALPTAPQQRDEVLTLVLDASEDVQLGTIDVRMNGVRLVAPTTTCNSRGGCWTMDMSAPALDGMTGNFTVTAKATDLAGNERTTMLGTVGVTRKRWEVQPTMTETLRAAPAVGPDGTVFVGSMNGANTGGTLFALNPSDGGVLKTDATLGAIQSLATSVSNDAGLVYYTANSSAGKVGARLASDVTLSATQSAVGGNGTSPTYSALGLVAKTGTEVGAIAAFNVDPSSSAASRLQVYWSSAGNEPLGAVVSNPTAFEFALVPDSVSSANNIVVNGTEAYLLTRPAGVGLYRQTIQTVNGTPTLGTALNIATTGSGTYASGQLLVGGESLIGGMVGLQDFYRVGAGVVPGNLTVGADNGLAAAVSPTLAFVGRGSDLVSFNPTSLGLPGVALKSAAGTIRTSPVLGKARVGQAMGLGYAVNSAGKLFVFAQDGSAAAANSASDWLNVFATGSNPVYAHPTLDCNRRAGAATSSTGILYVASGSGKVVAIVVDSPSLLDTSGAWPKYQRTAGNAGNTDNARFPLNPGCP